MQENTENNNESLEGIIKPFRPSPVVDSKETVEPPKVNESQEPSSSEVELRQVEKNFVVGDQREQNTKFFGLGAKEVLEKEPYFAKMTVTKNGDSESTKYSLAIYNGSLYNPSGPYSSRNKNLKEFFRFKQCSESCFNDYLDFLKTKKEATYWRANRSMLNG